MASRVTQVTVEVLRGRYSDVSTPQVYVSQLTLEMLVPYVDLSTYYQKSGSDSATFAVAASATAKHLGSGTSAATFAVSASATSVPGALKYPESAAAGVSFVATASATVARPKSASNSATFTQTAAVVHLRVHARSASSPFAFAQSARGAGVFPRSASTAVRFATANYLNLPEVAFDGRYRGRRQAGREVGLFVQTRSEEGVPGLPVAEPTARIYGPAGLVATVPLVAVRDSGTTGLFGRAYRLGTAYAAGRYDVLYTWTVGAQNFNEPDVFEVDAGGDPSGIVVSGAVCYRPDDTYVLAQTDTGRIFAGRRPVLATVPAAESVDSPPPTSPEVAADASYAGRTQLGREIPLAVVTRDSYGVPHDPVAEPTARIYAPGGAIGTVTLPKARGYTGLFRRGVPLGEEYGTGRYDVLYTWKIAATVYAEWGTFEVDAGGDAMGRSISLYHHVNPEGAYVLAQTASGRVVAGRRPRFA